jgi:hypothetical protein
VILRGIDWAAVLLGSTLGAMILAGSVTFARAAPPFGYLRLGLVALAAAAAFVLDEAAAAAVDAVPRTRQHRTAARVAVVLLPFAIWAGGIGALKVRVAVAPVGALLVEGGGVLTLTVALAALLRVAGRNEPGEVVSAGMCTTLLAVLVFDPPHLAVFPLGGDWTASTALWAAVTIMGAVLMVAVSRDRYLPIGRGREAPGGLPARRES